MLPFYPFYYIACKDMIEIKYLRYFLLIMLPINILNFDWSANELLYGRITGNLDIVNNAAYTFVALIPFVFLFKDQKLIPATILAVNLVYIIQGAKRGALIAGLIGLLFFLYYKFKTINTKHLMRDISFVSAVSGTLIYYLYRYYYSKDYIVYRVQMMTEGHTAGRDIIYASIFNNWLGGNILQWFFGFGFAASPRVNDLRGFAHNDWLELLSNFGLLGVFLYFVLFYQGFKTVLSKDFDPHKKVMLSCVLMMWLFISMISMGYLESIFSIMVIVLAFLIGSSIPKEYGANQNPVMVRNANI